MVGRTVWDKFFGRDVIHASTVCPYQLRFIMFRQLMVYHERLSHSKYQAQQEAANKDWEEHSTRLKALRSQMRRGTPY